ncbi:MAG TPA: hypothetical protein V6D22_21430 [Candidatus Obscuribacterales bacterium]
MFVYLLIAAEFAVLYTVFWYLYIREPKSERRIKAQMWGSYEEASSAHRADPTLPFIRHYDAHSIYDEAYAVDAYEYVLDQNTNHYVRAQRGGGVLHRMAEVVDGTFGQLNVKP